MSTYVDVLATEFVNDPRMAVALVIAGNQVSPEHCYREEVVVLLAAHMLALGDRAGVGGAVASKSEGGLSISFHASSNEGLLAGTTYGQEIMRLNHLCYGFAARTGWLTTDGSDGLIVEPLYSGPLGGISG